MRVAGMMSGTSLDGIDVAIVDVTGRKKSLKFETVAFHFVPYPKAVRAALLGVSNAMTHTAAISRLNFVIGELYAEALLETCRKKKIELSSIHLCGMHGQTIFHEGHPVEYLGRQVASTLQIGESAVVAERTGLWVISNFRERDIAAGGKGAPLTPYVDHLLFQHRSIGRFVLNIGGIANVTVLSAHTSRDRLMAFDTGPGNMIIDALVSRMTGGAEAFDKNGKIARTGKVQPQLLAAMMSDPYFDLAPPKTTGREQFGQEFVSGLIATGIALPDLIATATEFTAQSIVYGILACVNREREVIVSGGGVHNRTLMARLRKLLPEFSVRSSAEYGINPDAKEAIAFAVLAHESFDRSPGNIPAATGARRAVMLGKNIPTFWG